MKITVSAIAFFPSILLALSVFYIYYLLVVNAPVEEQISGSSAFRNKRSKLLTSITPLINLFGGIIDKFLSESFKRNIGIKLSQAGNPGGLSVVEYNGTRFLAIIFLTIAGNIFDGEFGLSPILTISFLFLGFIYPDIWLSGVIQTRQRRIFRDLPDLLDTLRLAIDAGMDLASAMAVVVEKGRKGPLLDELDLVQREISLGRTRREAFKNFADRIAMAEINAFVLGLNQADQLGASISPILKIQSEMARTRRWQLAEALVNKMPMKMLGPLVTLIFPASFIILFTPLVIQWLSNK